MDGREITPADDVDEFAIGAGELDVSSIGGYPVRVVVALTAGTLKFRTTGSKTTNRTATLAAGDELSPVAIQSIRGSADGTTVTSVRVYK